MTAIVRLESRLLRSLCLPLLVAGLLLAGCGDDDDDDGADGSTIDAAPIDAPSIDGGSDAAIDAGLPDASVSPFVCDPVHQTGCQAGQKCDIAASGTFACVSDGTLGDFRRCDPTQPNACAAGYSCRGTFFGDHRCARLCNLGEDQCRVDEPCNSVRMTSDGHKYRMCATNQECNPILDDCSDPAKHCTWNIRGVCAAPGNTPDGSSCQSSLDCQQGSACLKVGLGNVFKCFKMCDPAGGAPACTAGVACTLFTTVGPQDVGACGFTP